MIPNDPDESGDQPDEGFSDDPLELQQLLVESTLPLVFETYDNAIAEGMPTPVVLIVDCEDELGGAIARGWLGDDTIDDAIAAEADGDDLTTALGRAIPWDDARTELTEAFPYLAGVFAAGPPEDGVLVLGVTAGGASALTAPWDARP